MKISVTSLIPILTFLIQKTESRNQGCSLLILVDDSMMSLVQNDETRLKQKLDKYMKELNDIYQTTILKDPPNNNLYFFIKHVTHLKNFIPACKNKQIILDSVTKVGRGSDYCLVHFLMSRDIECIEGLGNLNGVCKRHSNTAWTNVHIEDDEKTVNTIAHEIGHNFGSEHDGQNSSAYSGCNSPETKGIMGGLMTRTFSTCSLSAMHHRLQQVYRDEEKEARCLTLAPGDTGVTSSYEMDSRDLSSFSTPCPLEPDSDCDPEQPDPPEAPEPPEPECGDKEVSEPGEECDCGPSWEECEDPCCYPASLTKEDLAANSSALPCTRHTQPLCTASPAETFLKWGLLAPFLAMLLLIILVILALIIDWRSGRRVLYTHITSREKAPLHIETEEQRERRLRREAGLQAVQTVS